MAEGTPLTEEATGKVAGPRLMDWLQFILRSLAATFVLALFWKANAEVLGLIERFAAADTQQLQQHLIPPADRIINSSVVLALIAGTVAQVATVLLAITRYLFPATA